MYRRFGQNVYCRWLLYYYAQVILVALDALSSILACDNEDDGSPWVQMVDETGGLDRLEQLQEHENRCVWSYHMKMVTHCFECRLNRGFCSFVLLQYYYLKRKSDRQGVGSLRATS